MILKVIVVSQIESFEGVFIRQLAVHETDATRLLHNLLKREKCISNENLVKTQWHKIAYNTHPFQSLYKTSKGPSFFLKFEVQTVSVKMIHTLDTATTVY